MEEEKEKSLSDKDKRLIKQAVLESAAKNSYIFNCGELSDKMGNHWLENVEELAQFCRTDDK